MTRVYEFEAILECFSPSREATRRNTTIGTTHMREMSIKRDQHVLRQVQSLGVVQSVPCHLHVTLEERSLPHSAISFC